MISTSVLKQNSKRIITNLISITVWTIIWQFASMTIGQEILLVSPATVISVLFKMMLTAEFWSIVFFSFTKIISGFIIAAISASLLAIMASKSTIVSSFLHPVIFVIKSTPVASFIILALLWIKSQNLSIFISFLMVFPVIYNNVLKGIDNIDSKMVEMARIFRITNKNKVLYIYLPQVMPYFISACSSGLGMCWKAGIAAEVIATPNGSIGDMLYKAKLFLNTPELFAWTLTVILLSLLFEKVFIYSLNKINTRLKSR